MPTTGNVCQTWQRIQHASKWPNVSVCTFGTSSRKSVCPSVCLSVCPRFPIRVKSTMADNLIERATWPVDLSRCRPISMPWEFVTQYDGNWGDVPRLSHLCTSFLQRHFLCFIFFFLFYFVALQFLWHSLGKKKLASYKVCTRCSGNFYTKMSHWTNRVAKSLHYPHKAFCQWRSTAKILAIISGGLQPKY